MVAQEQKVRGQEIALPRLLGKAELCLAGWGQRAAKHRTRASASSSGPDSPSQVRRGGSAWRPRPVGVTCFLSCPLCCCAPFCNSGCPPCIDLTFVCDAAPRKANSSMALYRAAVCCNGKRLYPQRRSNGIFQSTALGGARLGVWMGWW